MHVLLGIAVLVGLIAFAFGSEVARMFAIIVLSCIGLAIVAFVCSVAYDWHQLNVKEAEEQPYSATTMTWDHAPAGWIECMEKNHWTKKAQKGECY